MIQSTIKDIALSCSKVKEIEEAGVRESNNATLGFYLSKIYKLYNDLKDSMDAFKLVLLERKTDMMFFWEDDIKIFVGDKNSTSTYDMKSIYEEAVKEGMLNDLLKCCSITQGKVDASENILFKALIAKNKKVTPGEKNAELKIGKITKEEKLLNV